MRRLLHRAVDHPSDSRHAARQARRRTLHSIAAGHALRDLRARHGAFFVTGNHDHYAGADPWVAHIERLGLQVLRNRRVRIRHGEAELELAGVR